MNRKINNGQLEILLSLDAVSKDIVDLHAAGQQDQMEYLIKKHLVERGKYSYFLSKKGQNFVDKIKTYANDIKIR